MVPYGVPRGAHATPPTQLLLLEGVKCDAAPLFEYVWEIDRTLPHESSLVSWSPDRKIELPTAVASVVDLKRSIILYNNFIFLSSNIYIIFNLF